MKLASTLSLTILSFALALTAKASIAEDQQWKFRVYLNDTSIGTHTFNLAHRGDSQQIDIHADFDVRFLFLSVYQYTHNNRETWKDGCLTRLASVTNDNGDQYAVNIKRENDKYRIETNSQQTLITHCLRSFSYWSPGHLNTSQLVNAQNGEIKQIRFSFRGTGDYRNYPSAKQYHIAGDDIDISLWYSSDNDWIALYSQLDNGDLLRYERMENN